MPSIDAEDWKKFGPSYIEAVWPSFTLEQVSLLKQWAQDTRDFVRARDEGRRMYAATRPQELVG